MPSAARVFDLSANESLLGPSPKAVEAFKSAATRLHQYPDGHTHDLRAAIAGVLSLEADRIMCGNGSDELLHVLASSYAGPGDEVLASQYGFFVFRKAAIAAGATPVAALETNFTASVDAMLAAVTQRTKIVFLANPNNPTGSCLTSREIHRLHAGLPEECLLVLDAAYAEYATQSGYECGLDLARTASNVVVTRTFSKIHGLAALRVGWLYSSPAIIDALNRARASFNVSAPAQFAAAAAIRDRAHVEATAAHNAKWRGWLSERLIAAGVKVHPSACNFLMLEFPSAGVKTAAAADAFLMQRGLVVRGLSGYGLPNCLRLTVGTEEANRLVAAALDEFMEQK